jgi:hypothetical protein
MNAVDYLLSLGIRVEVAAEVALGHLSVAAKFAIAGDTGLVVKPRRGGISSRYLEMLAAEGIRFVLVDGLISPSIYGVVGERGGLRPIRALPIKEVTQFPNEEILGVVARLLAQSIGQAEPILKLTSLLFAAKIDDERAPTQVFGPELAWDDGVTALSDLLVHPNEVEGLLENKSLADALRTAAALLAGYRLTPTSRRETGLLLECLGRTSVQSTSGEAPSSISFTFSDEWTASSRTLVVSHSIGVQLLPLMEAEHSTLVLPKPLLEAHEILAKLFPRAEIVDGDFLSWYPEHAPHRLVIMPPLGLRITDPRVVSTSAVASREGRRVSALGAEVLYVEHALRVAAPESIVLAVVPDGMLASVSYSDFREWLLKQARLLAVVSLPPGSCFAGSLVRCSMLYLRKTAQQSEDYAIFMAELEDRDLTDEQSRRDLQGALENAMKPGVDRCA